MKIKIIRPSIVRTIGRSYLQSLFKPTPLWTHFYVTRHCNFNCRYCGAKDNKRKDPAFEEVCRMILKLKKLGCNCIALMGGEPTLRPDIVSIVDFCSRNQIYTQLSTNGAYLINPIKSKDGQTLLERLVAAGLGTVNLSVDSVIAGFDVSGKELPKASDALDALLREKQKNGLIVILNCVITKKNIKQVPTMLDFCYSKKVMMAAIFAQNPNPNQKTEKPPYLEEILFKNTDQKEVIQMVDYLISKKKEGYQLLEPIQYYKSVKKWIEGKLKWECDGGKYTLEVDTDGKIGICGYLPYLKINLLDIKDNFYEEIEKSRDIYQKWCTEKCLPSCMFCSSFYRQNPFVFLYSKLRYS